MTTILFVLPVKGGSGGAHSVMQEVSALRDLGVDAGVLVNLPNYEQLAATYDRYEWTRAGIRPFEGPRDLGAIAANADLVVATTNTSVHSIAEAIAETKATFRTAYYVQDYEPLFYETDTMDHAIATASFTILPNCTYFAKTRWLCDIVRATHGHTVELVVPSIDHTIYKPRRDGYRPRRVLSAMIRPSTPRRAPRRTIEFLERVAGGAFGDVDVRAFGVDADEFEASGLKMSPRIELVGKLKQPEVAALLRDSDFFVDLSDYQAFGRTAAEAMACGCIVLAPRLGGAADFIEDGINSFLADTGSPKAVEAVTQRMFSMSDREAETMRYAAMEAVAGYTPIRAAVSELRAFGLA